MLSKSDGSIIYSSGLLGASASAPTTPVKAADTSGDLTYDDVLSRAELMSSNRGSYGSDTARSTKTAEEIARTVFTFVNAAGAFVDDMGKADDVRLLRLRTRKYEIVVVPGQFLHPSGTSTFCRCYQNRYLH